MITFEKRVLYEYKIKSSKINVLVKLIMTHKEPKGQECKDASKFLDVLISEVDKFYQLNDVILSKNGKRPHPRSRLSESKKWNENVEKFYEKHPRKRPKTK